MTLKCEEASKGLLHTQDFIIYYIFYNILLFDVTVALVLETLFTRATFYQIIFVLVTVFPFGIILIIYIFLNACILESLIK